MIHQWWNRRNRARARLLFHYDEVITGRLKTVLFVSFLAGVLVALQCSMFYVYRVALDQHLLCVREDRRGICSLFLWRKEVEPVGNEKDNDSPKPATDITKTGSWEMRRKMENTLDELPLGDVLAMMQHDSNVIYMHRVYLNCLVL